MSIPTTALVNRYNRWRVRSLRSAGYRRTVMLVPGHVDAGDREHRITDICRFRVQATQQLARQIRPAAVIFCGWGGRHGAEAEAWQMRDLWTLRDVPLLTEEASRSTADNALLSAPLIEAIGDVDAVVVSSSYWHLPRTMMACWVAFWPLGIHVHPLVVWPDSVSAGQLKRDWQLIGGELRAMRDLADNLRYGREYLALGSQSALHQAALDRLRDLYGD